MNAETESIVTKIRNLFKMADPANGATQNEIEIALRKAKELMTRHGIEQMQVEDKPAEEFQQETINTGRRRRDEDRWIPTVIHQVFEVKVLFTQAWDSAKSTYRHAYLFVGEPMDVAAAKLALPLIYEAMKTGLNRHLKMTGTKWNTHTANSFFRGVAKGFIEESTHGRQAEMRKFKKEEQDRFAIVIAEKKDRIEQWVDNNLKTTTAKSRSRAGMDRAAFDHGRQVGSSIDFTTKLK
jgi:hypothetical protein